MTHALRSYPMAALGLLCLALAAVAPAHAQEAENAERPAFSLSTSETFTTRDAPSFYLTFRRIPQIDIRVYKVRDAFAFFSGLDDPHQSGTGEDYAVPRERTWIERLSDWKRRQRSNLRQVARAQLSPKYRADRRGSTDQAETRQRVQLNVSTFAQVPLLNPDQLVTSWRELLPNTRDPEMRRVPLEVSTPGVYVVEAVHELLRAYTIVIVSDVGLVTKTSPRQVMVFAADRFSGEPVPDCDMRVLAAKKPVVTGRTEADGVFEAELPEETGEVLAIAQCGGQVAVTDPGTWSLEPPARELVGYIYTDKPIYRPGHTVHVKSVLRWRERDALTRFDQREVEVVASDANDKVIFRRMLPVDPFGSVAATFPIPATAALGTYTLRVQSGDLQATSAFEVQEYRKPEFEVSVTPASRFVVQGNEAVVTVQARYYFGQPVANGHVRWVLNQQPYQSPLRFDDGFEGTESSFWYGNDQTQQGELRLDASGRAELRIPLAPDDNGRDYSARIEAEVTDASRRSVSGNAVVHATWGSFFVSATLDQSVFRAGSRADVQLRALDYLGQTRAGVPVTLELDRIVYRNGYYSQPEATRVGGAEATTGEDGRATAAVTLPSGQTGSYRVTVTAETDGRQVMDQAWLWVPGPEATEALEGDRYVELLADRKTYAPGDVARLMVRGDTIDGPILVTKEGQHVSWHRVLRPAPTDAIEVPVESGDIGDVYLNVAYMRDGRLYRAERRIGVPATERTLQVSITADQAVSKPQTPGSFTVQVTDAGGAPVRAQVSLAVIDEAVYGVRPDSTPDPVQFFYRREYSRVGTSFSRNYYFAGFSGRDRLQLAGRKRRPFTLADFKGDAEVRPAVRKDFPDAIYWMADIVTDQEGRAHVAVKYPDALTTWRLTARAVTEDTRAGSTVARTTTTKDLIVRIVTPRFLTEGDGVALPTIVHNYQPDTRTAALEVRATGLQPANGGAMSMTGALLESGAERRDDWRFTAGSPGTAVIAATATTETDTDAVELSIPVVPYGLKREAGASGSMAGAGEATASLTIPDTANASGRSVRVQLAPSLAGSLLGAMDFLTSYPYGCTEQTLSSFLPNLLVTRALTELKIAPTERLSALDRQVSSGIRRLMDLQHDNGGWGWWKADGNHPFMTAYALWGLDQARRAGVRVEDYRIENGAHALAEMYRSNPRTVPDLKAYMAYALRRSMPSGDTIAWYTEGEQREYRHGVALDELWDARSRMSAYGRALLLALLDEAKDARGNDLAAALVSEVQTRGDLSWWPVETDPLLFETVETSVEATAFAVQALTRRDPSNPVLERAVRWLLLNRSGGYWGTTKQTAMAIYGLLGFMQALGESAQSFAVDVYVNGSPAGRQTFTAAQMAAPDPVVLSVPARAGVNEVRLVKQDGGTVYWSAAATYFDPSTAEARSGSRQLAVTRRYSKLTPVTVRNRIVYREQPITGEVAPGDVLTVRLTMAGSNDWRYLALEDPLPAGVEAVQDTTAYPLERPDSVRWRWGSNVEYRDQRTVFFQESFEEGRSEYVYLVKVVSAGTFRAVPAQVSPMYVPAVFASSEPFTLVVSAPAEVRR
jgi:uncharacterized protein YfaS (alpha-2-macroglobulin family)